MRKRAEILAVASKFWTLQIRSSFPGQLSCDQQIQNQPGDPWYPENQNKKQMQKKKKQQAHGALGETSDKSDFSLPAWDSFSQEIRNLLLFYCQKSLNLLQMQ